MLVPNVKSKPIIAVVGPTASGKSNLALKLAQQFHGAIISADSRQIYQHAQIGTNQPIGKWQLGLNKKRTYFVNNIPHFSINFLSPNKRYSAVKFQKSANKLIHQLHTAGYLPILVGGTGLYISSITEGYQFPESKPNLKIRKKLERLDIKTLLQQLKKLDPKTYQAIQKTNHRRLVRALEHVLTTKTSFFDAQIRTPRANTLIIGLKLTKKQLQKNIAHRTQQMLHQGLIKETKYLLKNYPKSTLLSTLGYKEIIPVIKKAINIKIAREQINTHTWQYARRQNTWFKKKSSIHWLQKSTSAQLLVKQWLNKK